MTNIAETQLESFLAGIDGNYIAVYEAIVTDAQTKALAERPRSNAELRKKAYTKALKTMDKAQLDSMEKTVKGFMPLAQRNTKVTAATGVLDDQEAEDLMVEVLEVKRLQEIAKARYEEIRKRVFNSLTESFAEQGEDNPEVLAGYIAVPNLGLKFAREGGGFKDPELQENVLEALVGPEVWEKVTTVEVIPAQEVRTLDMELFLQLARRKPALLEELRKALKAGEPATQRFAQRAMETEE